MNKYYTPREDGENEDKNKRKQNRLIPLTDWNKFHPWPPQGGLRHLVFNKEKKGFAQCVRKVGRRVLIDEEKFFDFVDQQDQKNDKV